MSRHQLRWYARIAGACWGLLVMSMWLFVLPNSPVWVLVVVCYGGAILIGWHFAGIERERRRNE